MAYESNLNWINVFRNKYKSGDKQPDFKENNKNNNQIEVECPHCNKTSIMDVAVAVWEKTTKVGETYFSIKFGKKYVKPDQFPQENNGPVDSIPF